MDRHCPPADDPLEVLVRGGWDLLRDLLALALAVYALLSTVHYLLSHPL